MGCSATIGTGHRSWQSPCPRPPCMTLGCRDHRHVALGATSRAVPVVSPPLHDPTVSHHRGVACVLEIKPAGANAASPRAHCGAMGRTGGRVPMGCALRWGHRPVLFQGGGVRKLSRRQLARAQLIAGMFPSLCSPKLGSWEKRTTGSLPCVTPSRMHKVRVPLRGDLSTLEENCIS